MTDFNWEELLGVAKQMASEHISTSDEAKGRTAVNRAYFSAMIKARNNMRDKDNVSPMPDGGVHGQVLHHYKERGKYGTIWSDLRQMRSFRTTCDYEDPKIQNLSLLIQDSIKKAENIFRILNQK